MQIGCDLIDKFKLNLPLVVNSNELDVLKEALHKNASACQSNSWRSRSQNRFCCYKCEAKCVYKKVNESFILHKFKPHKCKFTRVKRKRGKSHHRLQVMI